MNLIIKNFHIKDISKKYLSWINNNELMKYSRHKNIFYTKAKAIQFYKKIKKKNFFLAIYDKSDLIGTAIVYLTKIPNIGILIGDQNFRGKNLAKKIINKIIIKLKKEGFKFVEIGSNRKNIKMIKTIKSLKFKKYFEDLNIVYFIKEI